MVSTLEQMQVPNGTVPGVRRSKRPEMIRSLSPSFSDMNPRQQYDLCKFIELIMSPKSKKEQQREALNYLQSNPNILHSLISFGNHAGDKIAQSAQHDGDKSLANLPEGVNLMQPVYDLGVFKNIPGRNHTKDSDSVQNVTTTDGNNIKIPETLQFCSTQRMNDATHIQNTDNERTKKRKSKYSDIKGDLSHIYREPKSSKSTKDSKSQIEDSVTRSVIDRSERECDVILVQRLIQRLLHPRSRRQQDCILGLLKADTSLREIFIDEKAKLGKVEIPVLKRVQCDPPSTSNSSSCSNELHVVNNIFEPTTIDVMGDEEQKGAADPLVSFMNDFVGNDLSLCQENVSKDTNESSLSETIESLLGMKNDHSDIQADNKIVSNIDESKNNLDSQVNKSVTKTTSQCNSTDFDDVIMSTAFDELSKQLTPF